jgi:hypothetical protein
MRCVRLPATTRTCNLTVFDPTWLGPGVDIAARLRRQQALKAGRPRLRRNYPYSGTSDGFTAYLCRRFPAEAYVRIELEINQKHVDPKIGTWRELRARVIAALVGVLADDERRGADGVSLTHT